MRGVGGRRIVDEDDRVRGIDAAATAANLNKLGEQGNGQRDESADEPRADNEALAYADAHARPERPHKRPVLVERHPHERVHGLHHGHHLHVVEEYAEKGVERPMLNEIGGDVCRRYAEYGEYEVGDGQVDDEEACDRLGRALIVEDDEQHEYVAAYAHHHGHVVEEAGEHLQVEGHRVRLRRLQRRRRRRIVNLKHHRHPSCRITCVFARVLFMLSLHCEVHHYDYVLSHI